MESLLLRGVDALLFFLLYAYFLLVMCSLCPTFAIVFSGEINVCIITNIAFHYKFKKYHLHCALLTAFLGKKVNSVHEIPAKQNQAGSCSSFFSNLPLMERRKKNAFFPKPLNQAVKDNGGHSGWAACAPLLGWHPG